MKNKANGKWAVDTNLLIYGLDGKSPYFEKTKIFFEKVGNGKQELFICQQNVLEAEKVFIKVYKQEPKIVVTAIKELISAFSINVLSPLSSTLILFHQLLINLPQSDIFDLYLAATLIDNKIGSLYTANEKDFRKIPDFKAVNPL